MASSGGGGGGGGSPCGACKFLRRKCASDCIFAPYFCSDQGPTRFAAIHKVFGASNVSKLLALVPVPDRCEAVVTIAYEAQARLHDPVYGCVSHIFALQQQVACLQAQLMQVKAQMAHNLMDTRSGVDQITSTRQWPPGGDAMMMSGHGGVAPPPPSSSSSSSFPITTGNYMMSSVSSQSSHESMDHNSSSSMDHAGGFMNNMQDIDQSRSEEFSSFVQHYNYNNATKKRPLSNDLGELQALALRMMRN